jgi:hypothetical protein
MRGMKTSLASMPNPDQTQRGDSDPETTIITHDLAPTVNRARSGCGGSACRSPRVRRLQEPGFARVILITRAGRVGIPLRGGWSEPRQRWSWLMALAVAGSIRHDRDMAPVCGDGAKAWTA